MITNGLGQFDAWFCRDLEAPLAELKRLLDYADENGISNTEVESARIIYEDLNGYVMFVYIPGVEDKCAKATNEAIATYQRLKAALGTAAPPPIRPDYQMTPDKGIDLSWVPWVAGGLVAVFGLKYLADITYVFAPRRRA